MDIRYELDRLQPVVLRNGKNKNKKLVNEYKHRLFFVLQVTDEDYSFQNLCILYSLFGGFVANESCTMMYYIFGIFLLSSSSSVSLLFCFFITCDDRSIHRLMNL